MFAKFLIMGEAPFCNINDDEYLHIKYLKHKSIALFDTITLECILKVLTSFGDEFYIKTYFILLQYNAFNESSIIYALFTATVCYKEYY